jgi:hypothetical protein
MRGERRERRERGDGGETGGGSRSSQRHLGHNERFARNLTIPG